MFHTNRRNLSAIVAGALTLGGALQAAAADQAASQPDVNDQINALKAKIDQLEASEKARDAQTQAAQQQATTKSVLDDAEHRGGLFMESPITGGYVPGKGFILQSDDGNYVLHPWLQLQFRNVTNDREKIKPRMEDDIENGFEVRRMKFGFDGNIFTPDFTYLADWATDRHNGTPILEEAWLRYKIPDTCWFVRGGQIKDPLDHEQLTSSKHLMAHERSLVADLFANGDGYVHAVSGGFIWDAIPVRGEVAFTDGLRSANTNFQDFPNSGHPADWGAAARIDFKAFGNWKEYDQFSSLGDKEPLLVFGAGIDDTQAGHMDTLTFVGDAQLNVGPLGAYGAFLGRYINHNAAVSGGSSTFDPTIRGQVSYLVLPNLEVFGRGEYIHFDSKEFSKTVKRNVDVLTAGMNWYIYGDNLKFTADVMYLPNGVPVSDDGSGILAQPNGKNEWVGTVQFQLLI